MATYTITTSTHQTLGASTVDTVNCPSSNFSAPLESEVTVVNRGADYIYFTLATGGGTAATPTAGGADTFVVPPSSALTIAKPATQVKLISASAIGYSVQVI
jgi:hypothetical protein